MCVNITGVPMIPVIFSSFINSVRLQHLRKHVETPACVCSIFTMLISLTNAASVSAAAHSPHAAHQMVVLGFFLFLFCLIQQLNTYNIKIEYAQKRKRQISA